MKSRTLLVAAVLGIVSWPVLAADWPQWRGPMRTEISAEKGLLRSWPASGPTALWTNSDVGIGYSGPAIVGHRLYTMGARKNAEYVLALDTTSGKEVWATEISPLFTNGYGDGPRGTPTVDGNVLYAIGGQGELVCLDLATGKKLWRIGLRTDLGGKMMSGWGYTESPLVDGDMLICSPGGVNGTLAALDKKTGNVLWRSKGLSDPAAYASCIVAEVGGVRQYVQMTGRGVAGVRAKDGQMLWRYVQDLYRTAVIPTPIFHDDHVYVTSGYGAGCDLLKLTPDGQGGVSAEKVYANKNMVNHHGGVVLVGDHLYGYSDGKGWVCQDFKTGENVWEEKRKLGKGSITCVDGQLYCYSESDGSVVLIDASPKGWKENGRFKIPKETTQRSPRGRIWTHPVVANGQLYLRDQELLFAFDVSARTAQAR